MWPECTEMSVSGSWRRLAGFGVSLSVLRAVGRLFPFSIVARVAHLSGVTFVGRVVLGRWRTRYVSAAFRSLGHLLM